jgi:hypothetical protein
MREFDQEIAALNRRRPDDRSARPLHCALPEFALGLKIPNMERPGTFLWPPPDTSLSEMLAAIRLDPFVGAFAADGTYAAADDRRRLEDIQRQREEAEQREREFEARQGGT